MNIGFDFDKVFINYPPLIPASIIDRLYRKKANGILQYRIPKKPEQILRIVSHHPIFRRPIKKNISFLHEISENNNNKYYLISSRFSFLQKRTDDVVKRHKLNSLFSEIHFNYADLQPHEFKDSMIKKLKINKYIDDDINTLKYLAKQNKNVQFFWLNSKHKKRLSKNLYAITDMKYILEN